MVIYLSNDKPIKDKYCRVNTNKVWEGFVGYRDNEVQKAVIAGKDLLCFTKDHPDEWMIVPNFLIRRRIRRSKMVSDKKGDRILLDYIWWESEQTKAIKKESKQQRLL